MHQAVYLKGQSPSLKITVEPLTGPVHVQAHVTNMSLSTTTAGYPFNTYSSQLVANETTITCPPLNNQVDVIGASLNCNFQCQFGDGTWVPIYARQDDPAIGMRLYEVYAQPSAPMATPWIGVLEDSCRWAVGKSTAADVAQKLTTGFHFSQKAYYDPSDTYCRSTIAPKIFRLTAFLNGQTAKTALGLSLMDCRDVSDYLCIVANAQGLNFSVAPYYSSPGWDGATGTVSGPGRFNTNKLCSMPRDPSIDSNYGLAFAFNFHQITHSGTGTVYDASNAQLYDLSGNGFRNPPFNWPLNGYWQTAVAPGISQWNPVGLVALPNPSTPTSYTAIGPYTPAVE